MDSRKTVLISGGAGYIGSHTAVELINAGYDVVIIDNLTNSERKSVSGVEKITGTKIIFEVVDTCDRAQLKTVFDTYAFDTVFISQHIKLWASLWLSLSSIIKTTLYHS